MSFSKEVKNELCQNAMTSYCKKAFISAIIKMNSSLTISNNGLSISISFENVAIIRTIYELLRKLYNINAQIVVSKQMKLKKSNVYTIKIVDNALAILEDLNLMAGFSFTNEISSSYNNEDCHKAYLAGSFVAAGSVNSPDKSNYHLEIQSSDKEYLNNLLLFINKVNIDLDLNINFKLIERRNSYLLYLKSAREITDFLNYIGASSNMLKFEDIRVQRDFMNSLNRMNNMDVANEQKTQKAATKQLEYIKIINDTIGIDKLEKKLYDIALLRLEHEDASLVELCDIYNNEHQETITKSGMNHRFRKIIEEAKKIESRGGSNGEK